MIEGFRLLARVDCAKLSLEFSKVFPGCKFKSTYYRQEEAWKTSMEAECIVVVSLPHMKQGLWTEAQQSLSGWQWMVRH